MVHTKVWKLYLKSNTAEIMQNKPTSLMYGVCFGFSCAHKSGSVTQLWIFYFVGKINETYSHNCPRFINSGQLNILKLWNTKSLFEIQHLIFMNPNTQKLCSAVGKKWIGHPVTSLPSPAFLVDQDKVSKNCNNMLNKCKQLGIKLRAQVKTHKTVW